MCDTLAIQKGHLEKFKQQKDLSEQVKLAHFFELRQTPSLAAPSSLAYSWNDDPLILGMGKGAAMRNEFADRLDNKAFEKYLDDLHQREHNNEPMDDSEFFTEADDTAPVSFADADIVGFPPYLPNTVTFGANEGYQEIPRANAFNNGYVQIVHSNGIHHLAMVSCTCQWTLLPADSCQPVLSTSRHYFQHNFWIYFIYIILN